MTDQRAKPAKVRLIRERPSRRSMRAVLDSYSAASRKERFLAVAVVTVLPSGECDLGYEARSTREKLMLVAATDLLHARVRRRFTGE